MGSFSFFDHTADLGLEVDADDINDVFRQAARGLFETLVGLDSIRATDSYRIQVSGIDRAELLVEWLTTLLYHFEVDQMVFCEFEVEYSDFEIRAQARGEERSEQRHFQRREVKAITYHAIEISDTHARVVLDI